MQQIVEEYKKVEIADSIWDKIIEFRYDNDSIILPANKLELNKLLNKKLNYNQFNQFLQKKEFKSPANRELKIVKFTVKTALEDCPDIAVLEEFAKELAEFEFRPEEIETFKSLINLNKEYKALKSQLFFLLSKRSKHASEYNLNSSESIRKLLRYYTPSHSEYVMKLVGEMKHKEVISNSIYMLASMFRFVLKQYTNELEERINKLEYTYQKTEVQMLLLKEKKIIIPTVDGKFEATPDLQTITLMILMVWKQVFAKENSQIKSFKDAHPIKIQEYSLNMFIALSNYMMKLKDEGEELYNYPDFISKISEEFAVLVSNNLKYHSFSQTLFQMIGLQSPDNSSSSVNSKTFEYKLELTHKLMNTKSLPVTRKSKNDPCSVKNETKIKDSIDSTLKKLTIGRKFVLDQLFVTVLSLDDEGALKRSIGAESNCNYIKEEELSKVMSIVSSAIASEAGIKVNNYDLKYLMVAKTLATLALSYVLNSTVLKEWVSAPMQIVMHLHSISYISAYLQQIIDNQEAKARAEFNKYNDIDKSFNKAIGYLFGKKMIYPKLDKNSNIDYLICDERVNIYLNIVARTFLESGVKLEEMPPEDLSAIAKILFTEITFNFTQVTEIEDNKINVSHITDISESLGRLIAACDKSKTNHPQLLQIIQKSMKLYVEKEFSVAVERKSASADSTSTNVSTSTDTSASSSSTSEDKEREEKISQSNPNSNKVHAPTLLVPLSSLDKKTNITLPLNSIEKSTSLRDSPRIPSVVREGVRNWVQLARKEGDPQSKRKGRI
ncbi:MAG: hypothetical protein LW825_02220 [Candidatus Jidaibacter sp.]|jgi:hypothetical protein|nr:hypothetical protein [Candidatus Jidaibacter sp.]